MGDTEPLRAERGDGDDRTHDTRSVPQAGIRDQFWRKNARKLMCFGTGEALCCSGCIEHIGAGQSIYPQKDKGDYRGIKAGGRQDLKKSRKFKRNRQEQ